jgi:hypothetical protein
VFGLAAKCRIRESDLRNWPTYSGMQEKVTQKVGWVVKPNVSDGLRACWVFNPTYLLCHFIMHFTILSDGLIPDKTQSAAYRDLE